MKRSLLAAVFLLFMLAVAGCKKDVDSSLQGSWELTKISGMAGVTNVQPGNGNTWTFTGSQFSQHIDGQLQNSGTFSTVKTENRDNAVFTGKLYLHGANEQEFVFYITDEHKLVIDFGSAFDAPVNTYIKK